MRFTFILSFISGLYIFSCTVIEKDNGVGKNTNSERARILLDSLYQNYSIPNSCLLREIYPYTKVSDETQPETASGSGNHRNVSNRYSYLWPYTGTLSAVNAMFESTGDNKYYELLKSRVLPGLENYFDNKREPHAYTSYVNFANQSDRYYDDNMWLGIDFTNMYLTTKNTTYLDKAKLIWKFILSGMDKKMGGGIYWCEQKKESKNTCSNAPGAVYAFKLFEATNDSSYYYKGCELYEWTQKTLQDKSDYLYFDYIDLDGRVSPAKYAYNSGQMMQAAALQYKLTNNPDFLTEARNIASSCYKYFFSDYVAKNGESFRLLKKGDVWFSAIMLRGFIELYHLDKNDTYIKAFNKNLDYAWAHSRDEHGLFNVDYSGENNDPKKWLLTQAAMVEMYARLSALL